MSLSPSFGETLERVRTILRQARYEALQTVNSVMVRAYWEIGRELVEEEQRGADRAEYGARLVESLAKELTQDFGKGFTARNLWFMRTVYFAFPNLNAVRSELSWTHYRLLSRVTNEQARNFYFQEAVKSRWSTRELERQMASLLFERLAKSREKESVLAAQGAEVFHPTDLIRDPYVLEFTGLPERGGWLESDLEQALMDKLQTFLLELGRDFFFVARQKRITVDGEHFYIDLVFYHRTLRCFVLIDLKVGKLTHQDIGQMLMYTGYYEENELKESENPPVGLILCTDKNEAVVRYTMRKVDQQVFAARYQVYLPSEEELREELIRERNALLDVLDDDTEG
jgi:predicted nuclease of restriction endonuclease-like (RecB) superfamily